MTTILERVFSLDAVYLLTGLVLWVFAWLNFRDRRRGGALFWFTLGLVFMTGGLLPHWLTGMLVLLLVVLDGAGRVGHRGASEETTKTGQAEPKGRAPGNKIFLPVLLIPAVTFALALVFRAVGADANRGALVGLGLGGVVAMLAGVWLTRGTVGEALSEGRRLNDSMGAVIILPQLLASLGIIFTASKVGDLVAAGIQQIIPGENLFLLVAANCLGMTLFTMVMGNSFAAFPVIAAGVLVPLILRPFGVDPAMAAILTLTAGSTGTLMTPMAANFNIVPTALLNMRDQYGVIKFQAPFAVAIWLLHVLTMWALIRLL
ncbi:MAG TPA: DUF979 family protein [Pyrinomonadaceae bacterium]|nr:DUF979 family protein [Pyrinomonadaceae bacterium]